eukprot:g17995.t1
MVLITDKVDKNGVTIYSCTCGGVAYVDVFGSTSYASYYSPALVFNKGTVGVPEAISHEFGHNLGLSHDGTSSSHGAGELYWAPIMGVGYYGNILQRSKGEYLDANQLQDDLAIISVQYITVRYSTLHYSTVQTGSLAQGTYVIDVFSTGNPPGIFLHSTVSLIILYMGYSNYASFGQYEVQVTGIQTVTSPSEKTLKAYMVIIPFSNSFSICFLFYF